MTQIITIVAIAQNNIIGRQNDMPWRLSEDWKHFRKITMGFPCIMGRKTYESLPEKSRPLPGRENIVLTTNPDFEAKGATVFHTFDQAIAYVKKNQEEKVFILGGATLYKSGLDHTDQFILTRIHADIDGDTRFPPVNWDEWEIVSEVEKQDIDRVSGNQMDFSIQTYNRKLNVP